MAHAYSSYGTTIISRRRCCKKRANCKKISAHTSSYRNIATTTYSKLCAVHDCVIYVQPWRSSIHASNTNILNLHRTLHIFKRWIKSSRTSTGNKYWWHLRVHNVSERKPSAEMHTFITCIESNRTICTFRFSPFNMQTPRYFFWFPLSSCVTRSSVKKPVEQQPTHEHLHDRPPAQDQPVLNTTIMPFC